MRAELSSMDLSYFRVHSFKNSLGGEDENQRKAQRRSSGTGSESGWESIGSDRSKDDIIYFKSDGPSSTESGSSNTELSYELSDLEDSEVCFFIESLRACVPSSPRRESYIRGYLLYKFLSEQLISPRIQSSDKERNSKRIHMKDQRKPLEAERKLLRQSRKHWRRSERRSRRN